MDAKLEPVLIVQKLMDLETVADPKQIVYIGPTQKTVFRYAASSASDANIIFNNITPPSLNTVMKRQCKIAMTALVTVISPAVNAGDGVFNNFSMNAVSSRDQAAAGDLPQLYAGQKVAWVGAPWQPALCLRACPLGSVISSADIRVNGGSTNASLQDYNLIRQFLASKDDVRRFASEFPLQADNGAVYENLSITSPFNNCQGSFEQSRGSFIAELLTLTQAGGQDTPVTATYRLKWTEQLFISPFLTGEKSDEVGLVNVNNLTISLRMNNLVGMLSAVPTKVGTGVPTFAVTIAGQDPPVLVVEFDTQNSILQSRSPAVAVYDYCQLQTYQQEVAVAATSVSLASLRLPSLPKRLYVFVAPTVAARNPFISDHFMRITNVSVNFNDKSALLATMSEAELYEMSAANAGGSYPTFNQYRFGCGSLIVIDCQKDLSVAEGSQAGSASNFSTLQISLTMAATNLSYAGAVAGGALRQAIPASYTAYQVVESPGLLYISGSEAQFTVQGASPAETLAVTAKGERLDENVVDPQGAGFGSILASAFKHRAAIYDLGKKIAGGDVSAGAVSAGRLHRRA